MNKKESTRSGLHIKANLQEEMSKIDDHNQKIEPMSNQLPKLLTTPIKSISDKKEYRVIRLPNGLTALLISDLYSLLKNEERKEQIEDDTEFEESSEGDESDNEEEEEDLESDGAEGEEEMDVEEDAHKRRKPSNVTQYQPAASLSIGVGGFEDPFEVPGFMHFLEHMVFMGSEKYPKENYIDVFTKKHGGYNNAHTDTETTTFYFGIQEEYFKKGLDIFSQFFIAPLMKINAMQRERDAVHSEFELSKQDDDERAEQLFSLLAVEGHPMSKFFYGNETTLNLNILDNELHKKLHALRSRHYSAQFMTLAVQARASLDTLQEWVTEIFSKVPNNGLSLPSYEHLPFPFPKEKIHLLHKIIPVKEFTSVSLTWALPSQLKRYKSKPINYISHFLGHEGRGSVLSYLKKRNWAIGLEAGNCGGGYEDNTTCCLMRVSAYLTNEGFKHVEEILLVILQYLKLLRNTGVLEWVFYELQKVEQLNFDYDTESSPIENVEDFSESMLYYPPEHYLTGDSLLYEFNTEAIEECLSLLTPDSCNIAIFSKEFEAQGICTVTEKWYGTKYCVEAIPSEWVESWQNSPMNDELSIPDPNTFIPDDFTALTGGESPEYPERIFKSPSGELWFKADRKYCLPRAYCNVLFRMECVKTSARSAALLELFLSLFQQQIQDLIYPATVAKYSCTIVPSFPGFTLKISGFNQKLSKCLQVILSQLEEFSVTLEESTFNQMKIHQSKVYHNATLSPSVLRRDIRLSVLQEVHWQSAEKLQAIQDVTKEELNDLVSQLFSQSQVQMLVQGNMAASDAKDLFDMVTKRGGSAERNCFEMRTRKLKPGCWVARANSLNRADVNGSVINYYQAGMGSLWSELLNEFIIMVMDEPVFDLLRTKEQLGYCVYCTNRNTYGILGISITVDTQANKFSVDHVDKKMEEVLRTIGEHLTSMSSKEFSSHLDTMRKMKLVVDVTLEEEVNRNWCEILDKEYLFDRLAKQVELIPKITQKDIVSWFQNMVSEEGNSEFRKLSVQIVGSSSIENESAPSLEDTTSQPLDSLINLIKPDEENVQKHFISNLTSLKDELTYYPVTKIL